MTIELNDLLRQRDLAQATAVALEQDLTQMQREYAALNEECTRLRKGWEAALTELSGSRAGRPSAAVGRQSPDGADGNTRAAPDLSTVVTAERVEQSRCPERMTPLAYAAEERSYEPDDWDQP